MSLIESFRASSARRQVVAVTLSAAVLGALLIAVYLLVLRKPYDVLFTNLRAMDAATIVSELDKKRVAYRLADGVVLDAHGRVLSGDIPLPTAPQSPTPQRRAIEEYYAAKVREAVAEAYRDRRIDVAVTAERPGSSSPDGLEAAFGRWTPTI